MPYLFSPKYNNNSLVFTLSLLAIIKYSINMFRNNTNIIGFLQRKSFFNKTPSPSPSPNSRFTANNFTLPSNQTPPKPVKNDSISKQQFQSIPVNRNLAAQFSSKTFLQLSKQERRKPEPQMERRESIQQVGVVEQRRGRNPRTFQSSRVQVKMCIQQLSSKIVFELRQLQATITQLTVSLQSIFYKKLNELKKEIFQSIEDVFVQARNNLNNFVTANNQKHLKKLIQSKHHLTQYDKKVKDLKANIDGNWRKVAGEMFVNNLDEKIETQIQQSEQLRKSKEQNIGQSNVISEQSAIWQSLQKNIHALIKRRCK